MVRRLHGMGLLGPRGPTRTGPTTTTSTAIRGRAKHLWRMRFRQTASCDGSVVSARNAIFAGALVFAALNAFQLGGIGTATSGGMRSPPLVDWNSNGERRPTQGNSSIMKLIIGIPSAPREGRNYLTGTIKSLLDSLHTNGDGDLHWEARVVVMNMGGAKHRVFHRLVERFSGDSQAATDKYVAKAKEFLSLIESPETYTDPTPDAPEPDHLNNPEDIPGRMGRKQNCDMLNLLSYVQSMGAEEIDYLLLMEDDFFCCPQAIQKTLEATNKLNASPISKGWLALRVSYGMNGIVMSRTDAATFAQYLLKHRTRKPVDLLFAEFVTPSAKRPLESTKGREMFIYRWNLFAHSGKVSTFPGRPDRKPFPGCSAEMDKVWSLQSHDREKFEHRCAATWEFTPCGLKPRRVIHHRGNRTAPDHLLATKVAIRHHNRLDSATTARVRHSG